MEKKRSAGILLHPTSLPGPYGIGDLGPAAHRWIDFLSGTRCGLWQILPLGPTGYGDSPYQCFSAFAGNPYLVSPEALLKDGLLEPEDLADRPAFSADRVDYGAVIPWKLAVLDRAYNRFQAAGPSELQIQFRAFQSAQVSWLPDFALFMALKETQKGVSWENWPEPIRMRESQALQEASLTLAEAAERHAFRQFLFFRQWQSLRAYATERGIRIIGDIPIFVSQDSADVWSHPELFYLDEQGRPTAVAGVPPDYFSPTGQLWGNPLYRWDVHAASGYAWWIARFRTLLESVDVVRLDHFRGFAGYWEVQAGSPTAERGRWVPGPGADFMRSIQAALGSLPIIAEDLGEITPDVTELRDQFELPGMKVLQFAFGGKPDDLFLPHNYPRNCVVYTGTHDNDTTIGWYNSAPEHERDFCRRYLDTDGRQINWNLIRAAWSSVADWSVAPMQDFLDLGNEARMNLPGRESGNWHWRMRADALNELLRARIEGINFLYNRRNEDRPCK